MTHRLRLSAATLVSLLLVVVVAACGGSASPTATAAPTPTQGPGGGLGGLTLPSGLGGSDLGGLLGGLAIHGDTDLEGKLPAQVCGTNAFKMSIASGSIPASDLNDLGGGGLGSLFSGISGSTSLSWAVAAADPTSGTDCDTTFFAVKVSGGDPGSVLSAISQSETSDGGTTSQASLGGKTVTELVDSDGTTTYTYINGDTIYGVQADDDTTAGQALSQLP